MRYSRTIAALADSGPDRWATFKRARELMADGYDVIELSIGEPDVGTPDYIVDATIDALRAGRIDYADGAGEPELRTALAERYTRSTGREISPDSVLCFPGTQTALYSVIRAVTGPGDAVLVGDPMYATYAPVIAAAGATVAAVPLRPERGFELSVDDLAAHDTPAATALLLNNPHNPTGAVLERNDVLAICEFAQARDLWIIVDEVYEEMVLKQGAFVSPLAFEQFAERVVIVSSISKSHAAPGLRSGWCIASEQFCSDVVPLSEAVLFGNQPFIADATAVAVAEPSQVAREMAARFAARAERLATKARSSTQLRVHVPDAGMFALVDVSATGLDGLTFAERMLDEAGVAVMPGSSFGDSLTGWVRVALTRSDELFDEGCARMFGFANSLSEQR